MFFFFVTSGLNQLGLDSSQLHRYLVFFQVSEVQREFQECSHNISTKLYEDIQKLEEGRFSRDTNDLAEELIREDTEVDSLDPLKV